MPSQSLWIEYPVIGILILASAIIAYAFYKLWHELLNWIETQDNKRVVERERQRVWQAEQDKIRDMRWQQFLKDMQDEWILQDGRHTLVLKELISKVETLIVSINNHDTWVRAKDRE